MISGQSGQNSTFLTLQWHCSVGLTAERGHRVTWETPALWRCHGCRPGRGRRVFKGEEENSEQSVTHRRHCPHSKHRRCTELQTCKGARTHQKLYGSPKHSWGEEDEKPHKQQHRAFPSKETDVPLPAVPHPSWHRKGSPKPSSRLKPTALRQWECSTMWGRKG